MSRIETWHGSGEYLDTDTSRQLISVLYKARALDMIARVNEMETAGRSNRVPEAMANHFMSQLAPLLENIFDPPQLRKEN